MADEPNSTEPAGAPSLGDLASRGTAQSLALGFEGAMGAASMRAPFRADLVGDPADGGLANGVIYTLLDQTCGSAVSVKVRLANPNDTDPRRFGSMATLDFRIDFIRPARPGAGVTGQAECYAVDGGVAFVRGLAFEDDPADPVATAQAAFMLTEPPAA